MKIGIIGSRGIPNHYGGFEQFAAFLSAGLIKRGHQVWVYNSHKHPYKEREWEGVQLIHCFDPEFLVGTAGQFLYDFNCIYDSRKRNFDIVLHLGYTSSSVWGRLNSRKSRVITNMDGLEWRRSKYSGPIKRFLKYAESLAVKFSDRMVADSRGIQEYLLQRYDKESVFIPYGANLFKVPNPAALEALHLKPYTYNMLIARLEPENSIELILDGALKAGGNKTFLVVGNQHTAYGKYLQNKFKTPHIRFMGGIYDHVLLDNLRHFSNLYFHGHTVGGTNPSLLEAMAAGALTCAHDNIFNRPVLGDDAFYFSDPASVKQLFETEEKNESHQQKIFNNLKKIEKDYSWEKIISAYEKMFEETLASPQRSL
jgi:glycosyltransferase involved in cell wall biosynthesis